MSLKLSTDSANPSVWRVLVAAKYAGVDIQVATNVDVNSKESLSKNPVGKAPTLETADGPLFEPNAIARYVARLGKNSLYGSNNYEHGLVDQWIDFSNSEIELPGTVWVYPILGYIPNNALATQKAKGDIRKSLDILNKYLLTRTFLVGNRITLADIVVSMSLYHLYARVLDNGFRKVFVNTNRWFLTCVNQPEFKSVIGEFKLCEKMEVAPEVEGAAVEEKKEKKEPKKEQPKKEQPKKEEKKEKPKDEEEEEDFGEKEEKKKSPLDDLPPSKFIMDEWKRTYSNKDIRKEALPWFWENVDKEGYSVWFGDYKYNNECDQLFRTCNLIGGWVQRCDKLRKYAFGSLLIFGNEPKLEVSTCWLFRGLDVPGEMKEVDDFEHYTWRKADLNDTASRELVNDYFAWDGSFGGSNKVVAQGKVFK